MDISNLAQYCIPIVTTACLILGYILKAWVKDVDNKYIPTVLAVTGAILGCVVMKGISLEGCVHGAMSGLASTGLHQLLKQYISGKKDNTE